MDIPLRADPERVRSPYALQIKHARVIPDPERIFSWEWVRHQVNTINWTNLILLVTVAALSSNITTQLNQQRSTNDAAHEQLLDLYKQIDTARSLVVQLQADHDLVAQYSVLLNESMSLGIGNLTTDLLTRTSFFGFQMMGSTVVTFTPSGDGTVLRHDGRRPTVASTRREERGIRARRPSLCHEQVSGASKRKDQFRWLVACSPQLD